MVRGGNQSNLWACVARLHTRNLEPIRQTSAGAEDIQVGGGVGPALGLSSPAWPMAALKPIGLEVRIAIEA